jgi:hypothetical protein
MAFGREKTTIASPPRDGFFTEDFGKRILFAEEVCQEFCPRQETFVTGFLLHDLGQDHYRVWKAVTEGGAGPYGFMTFLPEVQPRLAFNSAAARDDFEAWMRAYEARFFRHASMQSHAVPPLPESGFVGGHIVALKLRRDADGALADDSAKRASDLFQQWCWIVGHTEGQVWYFEDRFMFEDQNSAFSYKLRWG